MRHRPEDDDDKKALAELNPEPWMVECLGFNPDYCHWGPREDCMCKSGDGWESPLCCETWPEFGPTTLDDLNECVHFYFQVSRAGKNCETCSGSGTHPDAQWVEDSFYRHSSPFTILTEEEKNISVALRLRFGIDGGRGIHGHGRYPDEAMLAKYGPAFVAFCEEMREHGEWHERITEDEFQALVKEGRNLNRAENVAQMNAQQQTRGLHSHDAINRWILIETRCKRLGLPVRCVDCNGDGSIYTAPKGHLGLVLWFLYPRKGASRGIEIKRIEKGEVPAVVDYLRGAAKRNAERFALLPDVIRTG